MADHKRFKQYEGEELKQSMPMEFGHSKFKNKNSDINQDNSDTFQQALHSTHIQESTTNNGVEEERINVKDLYKIEKQQKDELNDWKKKEDQFEFQQMVLRSKIRLEDGRAQPIDLLAKLYLIMDNHMEIPGDIQNEEVRYPFKLFDRIKVEELVSLKTDLGVYVEANTGSQIHNDYWDSIKQLYDNKIMKLNDESFSINTEIAQEIDKLIEKKSVSDLAELETNIQNNLEDPEYSEEIDYWHTCITKIKEKRAKLIIDTIYLNFVTQNNSKIEEVMKKAQEAKNKSAQDQKSLPSMMDPEKTKEYIEKLQKELDTLSKAKESHKMLAPTAANLDHKTPANVRFDLNDTFSYDNMDSASLVQFRDEETKDYEEDEGEFNEDVIFFKGKEYSWNGKYKPRKPRFFNRV